MSDGSENELINLDEDNMEDDDDYERQRQENMRNNAALLDSLGLQGAKPPRPRNSDKKPQLSAEDRRARKDAQIRSAALKENIQPTRRSGRVAAIQQRPVPVKDDGSDPDYTPPPPQFRYSTIPKQRALAVPSGPEYETSESLEPQPRPKRGEDGVLIFEGRWKGVFTPNLTPEEMFRQGAFGGAFFCDTYSKVLKTPLSAANDIASLPFTLPDSLTSTHLSRSDPEASVNRFGLRAGQSLQEWEKAGWIWAGDPRGWAQWYTRFWAGRRTEDDERQVRRWLKVAGPTGRFKNQLIKKIAGAGGREAIHDEVLGAVVRQCLWQWGYELNEIEWDKVMGA